MRSIAVTRLGPLHGLQDVSSMCIAKVSSVSIIRLKCCYSTFQVFQVYMRSSWGASAPTPKTLYVQRVLTVVLLQYM